MSNRRLPLRTSTMAMIVIFVAAWVLYLWVRPNPPAKTVYVPATTATTVVR